MLSLDEDELIQLMGKLSAFFAKNFGTHVPVTIILPRKTFVPLAMIFAGGFYGDVEKRCVYRNEIEMNFGTGSIVIRPEGPYDRPGHASGGADIE